MHPRSAWALAAGAYVAYAALVLMPIWSTSVSPIWDGRDFNYPAFAYAAEALRSWRLPLWDPFTNCGMPFHADPQFAWYQPAAAVAAIISRSPFDAYALFWAATWVWAGLGAFVFASVLGAGPLGAAVAAISFSFSGFFVGHGQHLPYVVTGCWVPWVFALAHRAVRRGSASDTLLAGVALGLSALGGYAGLVVFECMALALWLALAFLAGRFGECGGAGAVPLGTRARRVASVLSISAVLLIVIWSPGLHSFFVEARDYTDRTRPLGFEQALGNPFSVRALVSFLFPSLAVEHPGWFPADVSMNDAYLGVLALPLAAVWVAHRGRRGAWLVAFVAFWFLVSLGADGRALPLLNRVLPPTRYMRHDAMLRVLFLAPLAAVAGAGATEMIRSAACSLPARWIFLAWLLVTAIAAATVGRLVPAPPHAIGIPWVGLLTCAAGTALLLSSGGGAWPARRAAWLVAIFAFDLAWHVRTNSITVWADDPAIRIIEALPKNRVFDGARRNDPAMRWCNFHLVRHIPVVEGFVAIRSSFNEVLVRSPFEGVLRTQRFWLSPSSALAPSSSEGLAVLARHGTSGPIPIFVESRADLLPGPPVEPGSFGSVRVASYEADRVALEVEVPGPSDALLASTERYARSWKATVDGEDRPVVRVNYFFRGVRVGAGRHRVVLEYRPGAFLPLMIASYGTVVATLGLALFLRRRTRARYQQLESVATP